MIALISVGEFFLIVNRVVDGMKQPFEVFDGFHVSWFGVLIWTFVAVMIIRFIVAIIGGE